MKKVKRLFSEFRPEHYDLTLKPNRDDMVFSGLVKISGLKTGPPSSRLTLHQKGLKVTVTELRFRDKKNGWQKIEVKRTNYHSRFDEVRLHAAQTLFPGKYEIELAFSGHINEQMHGIYPCNFRHDGQDKKLIATQFESHYAREVFPCIDEPEAKATFDICLYTPLGETVISNTPLKKQATKDGSLVTIFEPTPRMSTYLVALVFGQLEYRQAKTKNGVTVRTYATPDNVAHTEFALETAVKCIDFYEDYFDIRYPLAKLDMVALPDFSAGAMENWGLITYREQALLVDPKNTSLEMKQYVAMVVAHELAHQWFGNLVTMHWWTDLWLNEGFASWIEYLVLAKLFPGWHMWTQYVGEDQLLGLRADSLESTHPVEVPIGHPDEIRTIFDDISYQKGSAVIHMLQAYMGADVFQEGLRHYLKKHAYGNTSTEDLWSALQKTSGKPVKDFMHAWTAMPGYPLLSVTKQSGQLSLTQQRFLALGPGKPLPGTVWPIPLNSRQLEFQDVLAARQMKLEWSEQTPLINQGHSGFFATIYDDESYAKFGRDIEKGVLRETERLGLINDAFSAARAGYLPTHQALEMLKHYHTEKSAPVWDALAFALADIRRVFDEPKLLEQMKPYVRQLTTDQLKRLGWAETKSESYFDSLLRPTILGLSSWAENPAVVKEALKRFASMKKPEDQPPDLRPAIYHTAVRNGGSREFDKLLGFYESSASASEKVSLSSALTSFKQPILIKRSLDLIKSDQVRTQDISYWVSYSFSNRHAKDATWLWLKQNWGWLKTSLGGELGFGRLPAYASRVFSDEAFEKDFIKFFKPHLGPALERDYQKALETIRWQAAWKKRDRKDVEKFFASTG